MIEHQSIAEWRGKNLVERDLHKSRRWQELTGARSAAASQGQRRVRVLR